MPELPEVETVAREIRPQLVGRMIQSVHLDWPRALEPMLPEDFQNRIAGQKVESVGRRAKYVVIKLAADWLLIHLKMTGRLYIVPDETQNESDKWVHFNFQLDNAHQMRFSDSRKFGRVILTNDLNAVVGHLGPEPLEETFTVEILKERLQGRKTSLKPLLLKQEFIAGVGNIYADEALHRAQLHPLRRSSTLTDEEITRLHEAIRWVLNKGIERSGASIGWYIQPNGEKGTMQEALMAYGQTGHPCPTCGQGTIERIVVGQRSTHFCPRCQR
ncbi:MAG: bifunctional DNA-formamidopyrimidine glycosylase/DNA-(apurinic or apyrimidinic site) lyase [Anaerolineae bacterium]|nr:bifunctional DNA-formamidopyrimidine glycosylase/DNA-(apurinic or apyrimidinic site) lyase [Anaerolineae bacterium]